MMESVTIDQYMDTMYECVRLFMPYITREELQPVLEYSINKRYKEEPCKVENSYTNKTAEMNLLAVADYINSRKPIVTAFGTMFMQRGTVPNPLESVVQGFMDNRTINKKKMFSYPKGSEMFEQYNLLQQLDKIDNNGIYGVLGMYTSLVYNINVATSITSQGRSLVSSMALFFESFLANNVKYGSINEVLESINNICKEPRKYNDFELLDRYYISPEDCFVKVIMSCGYRWIPNQQELETIWMAINNLGQVDRNRVYYKNNLYEFMNNSKIQNIVRHIMITLDEPFLDPNSPPKCIKEELDFLTDLFREYVYYGYMYVDRIDRCDNMIKSVIMVSDTDSTIVSLDAWYRYTIELVRDIDSPLKKITMDPLYTIETDEFGDITEKCKKKYLRPVYELEDEYEYDFYSDELIELKHAINPIEELPQDNIRHALLNILAYSCGILVNEHMEKYCTNNHSFDPNGDRWCKIIAKNEFTFRRLLMTPVKKNYASLQELQEGNIVPESEQLDIKGIASMAKSSIAESTRDALKKILLEDIMNASSIDQFKIIKHIATLEKSIIKSLRSGSKEFYKPVTIKAASAYNDPMRIQGIKASIVWNAIRGNLPGINLDERNAVDIAKIKLNKEVVEKLYEKYPKVAEAASELLKSADFGAVKQADDGMDPKVVINSIAIPLDVEVPDWLMEIIDYSTIVNDNIGGFVYDSVGIKRFGKSRVNYTNILQL